MEDIVFESLEDLYKRIKPALTTKKEEDMWNYLKEVKWRSSKDLSLYDMTNDILNTDDVIIDSYLRKKLNLKNRKVYFEED